MTLPDFAAAYRDNPYEVAGFADAPTPDAESVRQIMLSIKGWAGSEGFMRPENSAKLLFGLLHVARESYAAWGTGDYWPHLEAATQGELPPSKRTRVRSMFRDALKSFGYPTVGQGDSLVRDVSYHCGVPDLSLAGLVGYAADVIDAEGETAIDLRARDLATLVPDQFPGLHAGVRRLLRSGQRGVEPLWAALTRAVYDLRHGETPEEAAGAARLPCGVSRVALREALHALQLAGQGGVRLSKPAARPPRLRYEFDSGSVRVWLPKCDAVVWALAGAEVAWDATAHARTACLLKPPAGIVTATGPGRDRTWHLRRDKFPGILFHAGSGHLLEADEPAGLDPGPCVLAWPGTESPQVGAVSMPLNEWSYLTSPGWSAWRVEVPPWHKDRPCWEVGGARLPLARRPLPAVWLPDPAAWADDNRTGERLRVYAAPPTLTAGRGDFEAVFLHRRAAGLTATRGSVSARQLGSRTDKPGDGFYTVRKKQGVGVTVARYAVLTDLAVEKPAYDGADGVSVTVRGRTHSGRWKPTVGTIEEPKELVGWRFCGRTDRPALAAAYSFEGLAEGTLHFAWPVAGLRWRVVVGGGVAGEWGRAAVRVMPADARRADCWLQVQADTDVFVNGQPVKDGRYRNRDGGVLVEVRLEGYAHAGAVTVTANGQTLRAAVFHDRPTLTRLTLTRSDFGVTVAWSSPVPGEINEVLAWNPLDPASPARTFPVGKDGTRELSWTDLVPKGATWPVVCVAMANVGKAGFRATPTRRWAGRDDDPMRLFVATVPRTPGGTPVNPVLLAVATYVTTRLRMHESPDAAVALAVGEAAGSPRSLPRPAWHEFLERLPAVWPAFRNRLAAWGTPPPPPPPPPAAFLAVDEYAARLDELSGAQPKASERQRLVDAVAWLSDFHRTAGLPPINDLCPLALGQGEMWTRPNGPVRWALWTVPSGRTPMLGLTETPLDIAAWIPGPVIDHLRLTWRREDFALTVHPLAGDRPFPLPAGWPRVPRHDLVRLCERWAVVRRVRECWGDSSAPALPPGVAVVEAALRTRPGLGAFVAERTKARSVEVRLAGRVLVITEPPELSPAAHAAWRLAFAARAGRRLGGAPDFTDALVAAGPIERVAGLLALAEMLCVALFTDGLGFAARWTPVVANPSPPPAAVSRR